MPSLQFIFPELVLVVASIGVLTLGLINLSRLAGLFALLSIALGVYMMPESVQTGVSFFGGMLVNDGFSIFGRHLLLLIAGLSIVLVMGCKAVPEDDIPEFFFFFLIVVITMMFAVASNNLVMIYLTLETLSIVSYILAGILKKDVFSSEAGIKYFLFGALSTGITLYGISLLYALLGSLDLSTLKMAFTESLAHQPAVILALILIFVGFAFKCSLVPFHMWTPDVYQGSPTPVAALFSVGPKVVGFIFIIRIFLDSFSSELTFWTPVAVLISVITMTVGNVIALKQDNIKRLLAYSTIAQAGYIFAGLAIATPDAISATLFYILIYSLMNLGVFGAVIAISNAIKSERISDYVGYYRKDPFTAIVLTICLLSLAGIPPLAGFMAKFFILSAAVKIHLMILVIAILLNSVIALYYYLRVIKNMFLSEEGGSIAFTPNNISFSLKVALCAIALANIFIGIFPNAVVSWIEVISTIVF